MQALVDRGEDRFERLHLRGIELVEDAPPDARHVERCGAFERGVPEVGEHRHHHAPVALGTHPFLRVGDVPSEDLVITLDAGTRFEVDERLIPTAEVPVDGTVFDLRQGSRVGDVELNTTFGQLGSHTHRLTAPDGRFVELWQDADFGYALAFATPFPKDGGMKLAVAIEPMTVPPNGFNSGDGLRWLEPDERWQLSWGIRSTLTGI